jgi:hypothetical protein
MNFKKNHFKKIIILTIIFSFITLSINPSLNAINEKNIISNKYDNKNDCYGYIIPLPESEIIAEKPDIQYSTMNLINDLLRLNISIYWLTNSISLKIKEINSEKNPIDLIFNPGTFLIPFTGNNSIDNKIIAVIYDYNISHEIHKNDILPIKSYMILQPLNLEIPYKLNEPKIAYYYGDGVYSRSLN